MAKYGDAALSGMGNFSKDLDRRAVSFSFSFAIVYTAAILCGWQVFVNLLSSRLGYPSKYACLQEVARALDDTWALVNDMPCEFDEVILSSSMCAFA